MIIDCDCHNFWSSSEVLHPYLGGWWKDCLLRGERTGLPVLSHTDIGRGFIRKILSAPTLTRKTKMNTMN